MRNIIIPYGIVDHNYRENSLKNSLHHSDMFIFLHYKSGFVIVVKINPPYAVKMLVLPGHHVNKNSEWLDHAQVSA